MSNKWFLIFSPKLYPCDVGGIEVYNSSLVLELGKSYDVHVLTHCDKLIDKSIHVHLIKNRRFSKISEPLYLFYFVFLNRKKIKIIYLSYSRNYWMRWMVFPLIKYFLKIPYFFTIHGGGMSSWKPRLPHKLFFKHASAIKGVSMSIVDEYKKRSKREIIYSPPIIPFKIEEKNSNYREKWNFGQKDFIILYVGSLKPLKSVDTLINAVGSLSKEYIYKHNLKLVIVGDGLSKDNLIDLSNSLHLQDVVMFKGFVKREDLPQLYAITDCYTICSEFEGLPVSLLEAYANGLPSIVSDAPSLKAIANNESNSLIFKVKDAKEYAQKIKLIVENKDIRQKLKKNALKFYENNYSFNKTINQYKKILDNHGQF